jgi:signal transduction histidine kinase
MGNPDASEAWRPDPGKIVEILSHELRSPITTIHLGTRVLHEPESVSGPVRREVVAAVEEETERLYRIVEDLLAVARHDEGANPLPVRPLLLQRWLLGAVDREVQTERRLRVHVGVPSDLPAVDVDEAALVHVLRNLLGNSARHAGDGMPVEVVVRRISPGFVALEVLDRGPGFEPQEADRLFEPFYRGPAAEAIGTGAGLGLAAGRRLMRAMGGDLVATPRDGGGARFTARLAVAEPDDERIEQRAG